MAENYKLVKLTKTKDEASKYIKAKYANLKKNDDKKYNQLKEGKLKPDIIKMITDDAKITQTIEMNAFYWITNTKKEPFHFLNNFNIVDNDFITSNQTAIILFQHNHSCYALLVGHSNTYVKDIISKQFGISIAADVINKISVESIKYLFSNKDRGVLTYTNQTDDNFNELCYNVEVKGPVLLKRGAKKPCIFSNGISFKSGKLADAIAFSFDVLNGKVISNDQKIKFAKLIDNIDEKIKVIKNAIKSDGNESLMYFFPNKEKYINKNWSDFEYIGKSKKNHGSDKYDEFLKNIKRNLKTKNDYKNFIEGKHKIYIDANNVHDGKERINVIDLISFSLKIEEQFYTIYEGNFYKISYKSIADSETTFKEKASKIIFSELEKLKINQLDIDNISLDDIRRKKNYLEYTYNSLIGKKENVWNGDLKKLKNIEICDSLININGESKLVATKVFKEWTPGRMILLLEQVWTSLDLLSRERTGHIHGQKINKNIKFVCNLVFENKKDYDNAEKNFSSTKSYRLIQTYLRLSTKMFSSRYELVFNKVLIKDEHTKAVIKYSIENAINEKK